MKDRHKNKQADKRKFGENRDYAANRRKQNKVNHKINKAEGRNGHSERKSSQSGDQSKCMTPD